MNYTKFTVLVFSLTIISGFAASENLDEDDFELNIESDVLEEGDTLEAELETPDVSNVSLEYEFEFEEQQASDEPVFETEVEEIGREAFRATVYTVEDGERLASFTERITVEYEGSIEINLTPEEVEPGDTVEAEVEIDSDIDEEDLEILWNDMSMTTESIHERDSQVIEFETFDRATDNPSLEVRVRDSEERVDVGTDELDFEWHIPDVEADGLEVEYEDNSLEASVSAEELDDRPSFRAGTSLDAWDQIDLQGFDVVGGITLELQEEDTSDFEDDNDLIPYSVVDVDGDNTEGLMMSLQSEVSKEWLQENDLLISSREADISYYLVDDDDWTKLSSSPTRESDNYVGLRSDTRSDSREDWQLEDEDVKIVIAGDPSGIDFGNFALDSQGECEELDEGEPVPAGWTELEVTCNTYSEVERTENQLDRLTNRVDDTEHIENQIETIENYLDDNLPGPAQVEMDQLERTIEAENFREQIEDFEEEINRFEEEAEGDTEEFREELQDIRTQVDDYEQGDLSESEYRDLHTELRDLRQEFQETHSDRAREHEHRVHEQAIEEQRPGQDEREWDEQSLNLHLDRVQSLEDRQLDQLPEELEDIEEEVYERPENYDEQVEEIEDLIENEEFEEAGQRLEEFEQDLEDSLEPVSTAVNVYDDINRLRNHEEIEEEDLEDLDEAESLLVDDYDVEEAEEIVEDVERSVEIDQLRDFVMDFLQDEEARQLVRDVISEVIPGL